MVFLQGHRLLAPQVVLHVFLMEYPDLLTFLLRTNVKAFQLIHFRKYLKDFSTAKFNYPSFPTPPSLIFQFIMNQITINFPHEGPQTIPLQGIETVAQLKKHISKTHQLPSRFQFLSNGGVISDHFYFHELVLSGPLEIRKIENQSMKKLGTFLGNAGKEIKNKTDKDTKSLSKKIHKKSHKREWTKLKLVLKFLRAAGPKIEKEKNEKVENLRKKLLKRHDASIIQNEETVAHQNETVQNILDNIERHPRDVTKKNLDALNFLKRKKYAESQFKDPESHVRSQQFVQRMQQQRVELEGMKGRRNMMGQKLEESMETMRREREEANERLVWEKRQAIAQRIENEKERRELRRQVNMQSNKLIRALKQEIEEDAEIKKQIAEEQKQRELEKQKLQKLLAQKKQQHSPITLQQLKTHARKHQEDLQLLRLEKEREKIEKQLELERNHVKVQRSVFTGVIEKEQKTIKNKLDQDKAKKKQMLARKMKYAEVVKDMFQPQPKQDKHNQKEKEKELLDLSQQDYYNFEEFVKIKSHQKNLDSNDDAKLNHHLSQAQFRGYISAIENIKYLEKRFNSTKNQSNKFDKQTLTKLQQKQRDDEIKSRYTHIHKLPKIQYAHYQRYVVQHGMARREEGSAEKSEHVEGSQVTVGQKINYLKELHRKRKEQLEREGGQEQGEEEWRSEDAEGREEDEGAGDAGGGEAEDREDGEQGAGEGAAGAGEEGLRRGGGGEPAVRGEHQGEAGAVEII